MERVSFVKNGVLRLPPGFRFHPTDQELLLQYLSPKLHSSPSPSFIPDVDVCKSDPWDLPGEIGKERYFFSRREAKYPNGNRSNRATLSGYWKATGKDKSILAAPASVLGMKKTLVFYRGKPPHGTRSDWIMHEYRLVDPTTTTTLSSMHQTGDWVLCRIFLKKRNNAATKNDPKQEEEEEEEQQTLVSHHTHTHTSKIQTPVFYDFLASASGRPPLPADLNLPAPCSSSSASSDLTQLSPNNNNHHSHNIQDNPVDNGHEESSSYSYNFSSPSNKL